MTCNRKSSHHMLSEIHERPRAVRDKLAGRPDLKSGSVVLELSH